MLATARGGLLARCCSQRSYAVATSAEPTFSFKCTACGKCCTGKGGRVRVNDREIEELRAALGVSTSELKRNYLRRASASEPWLTRQTDEDKQCTFLNGKRCSVYAARPTQCRTYPWWPQHLISDYDWQLAARECEGIRLHTSESGTASTYTLKDVAPEAIVYDIHRSGEDFTYAELHQMLVDLQQVEPSFVDEYIEDLGAKFKRVVVHQDEAVTVLDTYLDVAAPTRCFVFNDRPHLVQSEMNLSVDGESVDHSTLVLDIHQAMCTPLDWLQSRCDSNWKVAVIGAGGGSLVQFILHHHKDRIDHIHAVEPDRTVNQVAQRYFGSDYAPDSRLSLHEVFGEAYVAQEHEDKSNHTSYGLIMVDVEAGDAGDGVLAPPPSMLSDGFLMQASDLLEGGGVMVVNVITEDDVALGRVASKLSVYFDGLIHRLPKNSMIVLHKRSWTQDMRASLRRSFPDGMVVS